MPIDFTGIDTNGIYNPPPSASNVQYLLQLLEPYGITSAAQIAAMSDAQIQSLINQVVTTNTGTAPSSDVYTGGGTTTPPGPGLPPGYTYDAQGKPVPVGSGGYSQGAGSLPAPTQTPPEGVGQTSSGDWGHYGGANGTTPWDPTQGKPQSMVNAELGLPDPGQIPGFYGQMSGQPPAPGQEQPQPPKNIPLPPHTTWTPMTSGDGKTIWAITGPNQPVNAVYNSDGTPVWITTKDAQGNSITTYENGSKTLVTPNGWKTVYDASGKVVEHKWHQELVPKTPDQMSGAELKAKWTQENTPGHTGPTPVSDYLNQTGSYAGHQLPQSVDRNSLAQYLPENNQPHNLLKPGDYQMHPAVAAQPSQNINATFGGLGYSGPTTAVAAQPWQPPTPTNPNPDLGIVPGGAGVDGGGYQMLVNQNGVPVPYNPKVHSPEDAYKAPLDMTASAADIAKSQIGWAQKQADQQAQMSSAAGDAQASGTYYSPNGYVPKSNPSGPLPDDTPGYGNNSPTASGVPATAPGSPPVSTQPPTIQPPASQPPQVGIEPPNVLYGGGEVKLMPGGTKPVSYPTGSQSGYQTSPYQTTGTGAPGGGFVAPYQQNTGWQTWDQMTPWVASNSIGGFSPPPQMARPPAPQSPAPQPPVMPPPPSSTTPPVIKPPVTQPPVQSPTTSYSGGTEAGGDRMVAPTIQPPVASELDKARMAG